MAPAHQRLETREVHVGKAGDGLVMDFDLVALDGAAQFALEHHQFGALVLHGGIEQLDGFRTAPLRLVKCYGRFLHHLPGRCGVGPAAGNAHAGGQEEFLAIERHRAGHRLDHGLGELRHVAAARQFVDRMANLSPGRRATELAASVSARSLRPTTASSASPTSWPIAVHHLEAVEVDEQHEKAGAGGLRFQGTLEPVDEARPVGETRHHIVDGILEQALLGQLVGGDVGQRPDAADRALAVAGDGPGLEVEPAPEPSP